MTTVKPLATDAMIDLAKLVNASDNYPEARAILGKHFQQAIPLLIIDALGKFRLSPRLADVLHMIEADGLAA